MTAIFTGLVKIIELNIYQSRYISSLLSVKFNELKQGICKEWNIIHMSDDQRGSDAEEHLNSKRTGAWSRGIR